MNYYELSTIAAKEFPDIILSAQIGQGKLRLFVIDGSFVDVWFSKRIEGRFAYHWERRHIDGRIYRYDNRPHERFKQMKGFPTHFHNGSDEAVRESKFSPNYQEALREFLHLVREKLSSSA